MNMKLTELCIQRPVMVALLSLILAIAGLVAHRAIPVSALPSHNTPVIHVQANLSGASSETMATSVALRWKKNFLLLGTSKNLLRGHLLHL